MLDSSSSWISLIASSALGILGAVIYLILFKQFTAQAFKSPGSFNPTRTVSGLFLRLILTGAALFFISRIHSVNLLVVLLNFVTLATILLTWTIWNFSRRIDKSDKTQVMKGGTVWSPLR